MNISVECPSDLGANLVQHFIGRYSRYSRYQTVLSKLQEIIGFFEKFSTHFGGCCFLFGIGGLRARPLLRIFSSRVSMFAKQDAFLQGMALAPPGVIRPAESLENDLLSSKKAVQFAKTLPSYLLFTVFIV